MESLKKYQNSFRIRLDREYLAQIGKQTLSDERGRVPQQKNEKHQKLKILTLFPVIALLITFPTKWSLFIDTATIIDSKGPGESTNYFSNHRLPAVLWDRRKVAPKVTRADCLHVNVGSSELGPSSGGISSFSGFLFLGAAGATENNRKSEYN